MLTTLNRMRRGAVGTIAAVFAFSGLVALSAAPAQAEAFDPSCSPPDPAIATLKISPTQVNVKTGKRTVVISGTTTGGTTNYVYVGANPVGKGSNRYGSARPKGNSFSVKIVVPRGAGKGRHNIHLRLSSEAGGASYEPADLAAKGLPSSFNVISKPDLVKPTIKTIKLSTKKVNTTRKAAKVRVSATMADKGGSGLDYADVMITNGRGFAIAHLKKKQGKWVGTAIFPMWAGNKKASVAIASVFDVAGNEATYGAPSARKLTKALKPGFKVVSNVDRKAPSVGTVSVTPSTTKVGERRVQVKYAIKASDAQSGVASVDVVLVQRGGGDYPFSAATSNLRLKKGVWTGVGIVYCFATAGTYDVVVASEDHRGNRRLVRKGSVTFTD